MQHLGLIAIIIYWGLVGFILYRWRVDKSKTISDHVATGKQKIVYTPVALLYFFLMTWFLFDWFLPTLQAEPYQYVLLSIGVVFLFLTFVFPRHGKTFYAHDVFAAIVGSSIFLLMASIIIKEVDGVLAIVSSLGLLGMMTTGTLLIRKGRKNYMQAQVFYFAMFHGLILLLTYTR